ncbi:MAG: hypothetical protein AAF413_04320 [Patescibacteria group bacterium]
MSIDFVDGGVRPFIGHGVDSPVHILPKLELHDVAANDFSGEVCINGEPLCFYDQEMPNRIHSALLAAQEFRRRGVIDCTRLAILMSTGLTAEEVASRRIGGGYIAVTSRQKVGVADIVRDEMVGLHVGRKGFLDHVPVIGHMKTFRHMVFPAHLVQEDGSIAPNYIHKVGDYGPVVMSDLGRAHALYKTSRAFVTKLAQNNSYT